MSTSEYILNPKLTKRPYWVLPIVNEHTIVDYLKKYMLSLPLAPLAFGEVIQAVHHSMTNVNCSLVWSEIRQYALFYHKISQINSSKIKNILVRLYLKKS